MDKILESANQQASLAVAAAEEQFDERLFQEFMEKNPIWDFHSLSKEEYVAKGREEKLSLIKKYYNDMKNGELLFFFVFFLFLNNAGSNKFI